jgi:hypothetical protein
VLAIAAALEAEALEKPRREAVEPDGVDGLDRPEVDLEAARLLSARDGEHLAALPGGHARRRPQQQVWNRGAGGVHEPQVRQARRLRPGSRAAGDRLRKVRFSAGEQRHVDNQPLRARASRHDRPLHAEAIGGRPLRVRHSDRESRHDGRGHDPSARHQGFSDFASTYF